MPQARNIRARLLSAYHGTGQGGKGIWRNWRAKNGSGTFSWFRQGKPSGPQFRSVHETPAVKKETRGKRQELFSEKGILSLLKANIYLLYSGIYLFFENTKIMLKQVEW
jgi:hypothetical protein